MAWSMVKEDALRSLRPVGSEFSDYLMLLSDVDDETIPAMVDRIRASRAASDEEQQR